MKNNHEKLKSNVDFETLPNWFKNAKTKDAVIIYENNYLTFKSGRWEDGYWVNGTWLNGIDRRRY
jgi:hypothetical protein